MRIFPLAVQSFAKHKTTERKPSERIFAEHRSAVFLFH